MLRGRRWPDDGGPRLPRSGWGAARLHPIASARMNSAVPQAGQWQITKRLVDLAWPIIGLNVLQVLALAVDTAMVGRLDDAETALTGMGFAGQMVFLLMVAMIGLTVGTVAFIARAHGAGDSERVNHIFRQSTQLTVVLGIFVAVLGNLFAVPFLHVLGADEASMDSALAYLRPLLLGTAFNYLNILFAAVLRGVGNTRLAFVVAVVMNGLNVLFNYGLILGSYGLPQLGIFGAAIGTVLAQICAALLMVFLLHRNAVPGVRPALAPQAVDRALAADLFRIGWPAGMDMVVLNAGFLTIIGLLARVDGVTVAAHAIGLRVQALAFVPGMSISQATGALVGTPAYMSPEQGMGLHVSEASDIYALGIILYEMLTGQVPFTADTPFGIIHKHINEPLPPPRTFRDDIPASLEAVLLTALEKEPADRYQSPAEMITALEAAIATVANQETIVETEPPKPQIEGAESSASEPIIDPTIASRATVAMPPEEDIAQKETVVMAAAQESVEITKVETPKEPAVPEHSPELEEKQAAVQSHPKPKQKKAVPQSKRKPVGIILGVVGILAVAAFLIWGLPLLSGDSSNCGEVAACHQLAEELMESGDLEGAIWALDIGLGSVPANEHPQNANLWCFRGEVLTSLERFDEAIWSFEDCMAWTEDDPGLEDLRIFANDQIEMINNR